MKITDKKVWMPALIISVLLHLSVNVILSSKGGGGGIEQKGNGKSMSNVNITILDKPSDKTEPKEEKVPEEGKIVITKKEVPPEQKYVEHKCARWYGGVGFTTNIMRCEIIAVGKGYPADRMGFKVGDLVTDEDGRCPTKGEPGTKITIVINRSGQKIVKTLIREKICIEEPKVEE